jgi:hypothetical protein
MLHSKRGGQVLATPARHFTAALTGEVAAHHPHNHARLIEQLMKVGRPPLWPARHEAKGQQQIRELAQQHRPGPVETYLRDLNGRPIPPDALALLEPARKQFLPSAYVMEGGQEAWERAVSKKGERSSPAAFNSMGCARLRPVRRARGHC